MSFHCLRALRDPIGRLAQRSRSLGNVYPPLQPVRSADLPWPDPLTALAGARPELDVLVGATTEESRAFFDLDPAVGAADQGAVLAALEPMVAAAADVYARYQQDQPGRSPGQLLASIVTDKDFRAPAIRAALVRAGAAHGATGRRAGHRPGAAPGPGAPPGGRAWLRRQWAGQ